MAKRRSKPSHSGEYLYGRQAVRETLRAGRRQVQQLYIATGLKPSQTLSDILSLASHKKIPLETVGRRQLDELTAGAHHQGVVLACSSYPYARLQDIFTRAQAQDQPPLLLLLDRLQDPQNLGSLLRTAEAYGVHGVITLKHRAAGVSPAVVSTSAGAVEHLLICQETNLVATIKTLKKEDMWIAGLEKREGAVSLSAVDWVGPVGIVVGSEGFGLSRLVREHCDWLVALPMFGQINSLNAAVAGSIVIFWAIQQRRAHLSPEKA